jgi:hypothetical protein
MYRNALFATVILAIAVALIGPALITESAALAAPVPVHADDVGMFDPSQGIWHLGTRDGVPGSFYFGIPGDYPIMGDWDCDEIDTPGLYRQSDGYVYLRNTNSQGVADIKFFFGNPGDTPLAGDFNGDGCDTVSLYRPAEARIYVINALGSNDGGLGAADYSYLFGNTDDKPFVGDFDDDGADTVGLHRETTGFVYFRNTNATGIADHRFYFGDPGDRLVANDWTGSGTDSPGVFRPTNSTMYLRYKNTQGNADEQYRWGLPDYIPVAGKFGTLDLPPLGCSILPPDNVWSRRVDTLPLDARSDQYVSTIGQNATLHADFGSGVWPPGSNSPIGIPFIEVYPDQPLVDIIYTDYGSESDPGPFPIPPGAPIEGGPDADGDRHVTVLDRGACKLYELFYSFPQAGGAWSASSGASYDLTSNALRPDGWTSADAAGLPIFPGLITYDEVASGVIHHAIRFTAPQTRNAHVWPARHHASSLTGTNYPPMGQRFRLKAGFDISAYSPDVRVMLQAFKDYGLILADNGSSWYISGAPDDRWNNDMLHEWDDIPGSAFEAVDVSSLMVDPNSGATGP